ncbi:cation:proton antiporter subunit C [Marispirochaeta sp.]|jgi:multicomponent Na+:H+ antiporter subunit C|uniref:sodium:proton antiporter n=1 Tax=Marispirochaeta sp. TaxID=2038653 RepID=UPI0029C9679D|nr:cation:proton antiporter subunit C [Marispirochaeta sp.]
MAWLLIGAIFLIGLWGIMNKANMIKKVMALSIANSAVILLFIYYSSFSGETAPIEGGAAEMVDPLPQALMLTAIVVGICVVALALVLIYRLYLKFGTLDMRTIEKKAWELHD